ncbi:MAG: nucleotidyltransferase domain-containing protein [Candidatus Micrarchaeota archaeon]
MVSIDNAKAVLKPFFFAPSKAKYIREIAKDCELSYERVQHYLKELEKIKAVESKTKGKIKEYTLNRKHELVLKIFSLLEMERRQAFYAKNPKIGINLQAIAKDTGAAGIRYVILFGSAARGEARKESDIDLLFVLKQKDDAFEKQLNDLAKKMEALSGRRFSMHTVSIDELKSRWKKEPVYTTLWQDHIILYGDEEFWRDVLEMGEPG